MAVDGILLIDKPAGLTSHDVVALVKRALPAVDRRDDEHSGGTTPAPADPRPRRTARPKVGHAGTLDPFATGLLIVLVGRATKVQQRIMELPKRYQTLAQLGATSTTGDPEGEIVHTGRLPPDSPLLPTGQVRQRPPRHSAVKIGGERAYRRARRGEQFEPPERIVTVQRFQQVARESDPDAPGLERAGYEIECSSGTYIRSLIADLHDAYCLTLRRTAIGPFEVRDAIPPPHRGERWEHPPLIGLQAALARLSA
jgi:tRNA pseudouridine55 synthase